MIEFQFERLWLIDHALQIMQTIDALHRLLQCLMMLRQFRIDLMMEFRNHLLAQLINTQPHRMFEMINLDLQTLLTSLLHHTNILQHLLEIP